MGLSQTEKLTFSFKKFIFYLVPFLDMSKVFDCVMLDKLVLTLPRHSIVYLVRNEHVSVDMTNLTGIWNSVKTVNESWYYLANSQIYDKICVYLIKHSWSSFFEEVKINFYLVYVQNSQKYVRISVYFSVCFLYT